MHLPRPLRHLGGMVAMLALVAVGFVAAPGSAHAAPPKALSLNGSYCAHTILKGDKDGCVTRLQQILVQHGHDLEVDGSFGDATLKEVKAFQKAKGITVDGRVGPETRKTVEQWRVPSDLSNGQCAATVRRGDKGGCVIRVQRQLSAAGFDVPGTGNFAGQTEAQVKAFQKSKSLEADGIVGAATKKALGNPVVSGRAAIVQWAKAANDGNKIASKTLDNGVKTKAWGGGKITYSFGGGHSNGIGPSVGSSDSWVGIDCSGLTRWAYALAYGKDILGAKASRYVETEGTKISRSQLQPGDLVYYKSSSSGDTMHVAVFIGNGKIIESTRADGHKSVRENNVDLPGLIISSYRSYV